jgi:hypothetical protein
MTGWGLSDKIAAIAIVVGFLQFVVLVATVLVMRNTAKRQLRAYVFVTGKQESLPEIGAERGIGVWLAAKNSGQTPAYKVRQWLTVDFLADPRKGPYRRPGQHVEFTEAALGPNSELPLRANYPGPLTNEQISGVRDKSLTLCIWGEVTYEDAFGRPHYSRFRFLMPVERDGRILGIQLAKNGNEAN